MHALCEGSPDSRKMVSDQLGTLLVDNLIHLVAQNARLIARFLGISEGYGI